MLNNTISLKSLLETHEWPFVVIDSALTVVAVNKAWEQFFSADRQGIIGQPCCGASPLCRHQDLFEKLEPYEVKNLQQRDKNVHVKGYPLIDADGTVYLGEVLQPLNTLAGNGRFSEMAGSSEVFERFRESLCQAAQSSVPVMLSGETGTGKELAAAFIHRRSSRKDAELIVVDCTVLNEELFESELFGHEKGSFTGASSSKKGLFELADQGTLFFDEIGELPLSQQPKLLRALETGQFRRVGGTKALTSNVRVVCATHRNLAEMVKRGRFREDLFYRLSVFPIYVPPLRERLQDIPGLVDCLLKQLSRREGNNYSIDKKAVIKLFKHQWPGNIRELKNCLQLSASLCSDHRIGEDDIMYVEGVKQNVLYHPLHTQDSQIRRNPLTEMESEVIKGLIDKYQGNRKLIAAEMDISERTLYRKLKRFNLN